MMVLKPLSDDEYYAKYEKIAPLDPANEGSVFADGRATHNKPLIEQRPTLVLPNLSSFDPALMTFQRAFRDEVNSTLVVKLDENKMTSDGYHRDMSSFCTVSGYGATPISAVPRSNRLFIEHMGLLPRYTPTQAAIASNVWRLVFKSYKPSRLNVPRKSQSGARRRTFDEYWKRDYVLWMLEGDRFERMLQAVDRGDHEQLADEFEIAFLMYLQKRGQVDRIDKVRKVFTLSSVLKDLDPIEIDADKRVVIDGQEWVDFSAMRMRTIHAGPWALNWFLQVIATGHMQAMFVNFPKTWHVNTDEQITSVVNGKYIYASDVENYDRSMKDQAIEVPHIVAREFWDERMIDASWHLYRSAYYSRPLGMGDKRGSFVGDFRDFRNEQVFCGNRSGHAWTSLIAKVNKVVECLWIFSEMGYSVVGNEATFLRGDQSVGVVNNGDDEIAWFTDERDFLAFKKIRENGKENIYKAAAEDGAVYSGRVLMKHQTKTLHYVPVPRLNTAFEKIYVPERGIDSKMRPFWVIGVMQRINERASHPLGPVVWEIHDRLFHDILSHRIGSMMSIMSDAVAALPRHQDDYSAIDREVIDDPGKIHYKYVDGEVSDHAMELIAVSLQSHYFVPLVQQRYKGNLEESNASHES